MARKLETFLNLVLKIYQAAIGALEAVDAPRFLCDAPLFVLKKSAVVEKVPLQIYCSALVVVPDRSIVKIYFSLIYKMYYRVTQAQKTGAVRYRGLKVTLRRSHWSSSRPTATGSVDIIQNPCDPETPRGRRVADARGSGRYMCFPFLGGWSTPSYDERSCRLHSHPGNMPLPLTLWSDLHERDRRITRRNAKFLWIFVPKLFNRYRCL